jgi:hypothetical protein
MRPPLLATWLVATAALLALSPDAHTGVHADAHAGGSALPHRTVARVPLSGAAVRFDYTSLDPRTNELWISHMDADRLLAARSGHILVDVQTRGELAIVDPRSNRIVRHLALRGCANPHGLLVDSSRRLAFIACDANARLLTLDLRDLRIVGDDGVGDTPDVLAFDSSLRRLYVSAESGVVAVFAEHPHSLTKLGQAMLAPYAHTVAVDPRTHLVYFPLESGSTGKPQLLIMAPA